MSRVTDRRSAMVVALLWCLGLHGTLSGPPATAAIYRWDNGELITGRNAEPGAEFLSMDLSYADLPGASLFAATFAFSDMDHAHLMDADLRQAAFFETTLTNVDFSRANLADAHLELVSLGNADFTGAVVTGTYLADATSRGFTAEQLYSTASHQGGNLNRIDLSYNDLSGWSFTGKDLTDARFWNATLTDADLSEANLTHANLRDATLSGANLSSTDLTDAYLPRVDLTGANLNGSVLTGANLAYTTARGLTSQQFYSTASYQDGDLNRVNLMSNDLSGWDFAGKNLTYAVLRGATLADGDFSEANLTHADLYRATLAGVDFTRAVVIGANFAETTHHGFTADQLYSTASHQSGDLREIVLSRNDLSGWNFSGKDLTRAGFAQAELTDADFSGATLAHAGVTSANLTRADFTGADLTRASFGNAVLTDADLSGAVVIGTWFSDTTHVGFTAAQLYSTASYQNGDLSEIVLRRNDLSGWRFDGQNLTDARFGNATLAGVDFDGAVVTGANFHSTTRSGFTAAQLYSTASYESGDLSRIGLSQNDLSGWDFSGKNLTDASFYSATLSAADFSGANLAGADLQYAVLTDTDFTGAIVTGASFRSTTDRGFSREQLYSTASYQNDDLRGIVLAWNDLREWDFGGKNLADAFFVLEMGGPARINGANLSLCDLRGALVQDSHLGYAASTDGAILPDGRVEGLTLEAGQRRDVWDYHADPPIPITVELGMSFDPDAALRMVFEDDSWGSTISFEPGIDVALGGSLELTFADDVRPVTLIGTTFDLFDWDAAVRIGRFDRIVTEADAVWDTTDLYATGEVTLLSAVPEPSTFLLLLTGLLGPGIYAHRRRKRAAG